MNIGLGRSYRDCVTGFTGVAVGRGGCRSSRYPYRIARPIAPLIATMAKPDQNDPDANPTTIPIANPKKAIAFPSPARKSAFWIPRLTEPALPAGVGSDIGAPHLMHEAARSETSAPQSGHVTSAKGCSMHGLSRVSIAAPNPNDHGLWPAPLTDFQPGSTTKVTTCPNR